jgi:predicted exporter
VKRAIRVAFLTAALAMVAHSAARLRITTDVTNFLPDQSATELAALSRELAQSELARTMVIGVGGEAPIEALVGAAQKLSASVESHPEVAWIRSGPRPDLLEELFRLYFSRRYYFLAREPEREFPGLLQPDELRERARAARAELAMPSSPLSKRLVAADPLGAFRGIVERLGAPPDTLGQHDGHFVSRERDLAIFMLGTRRSAFDSRAQRRLLGDLEQSFREIAETSPFPLRLLQSGGNRIAVHAEDRITRDVYLIAAVSSVGVGALFLLFFRSVQGLLLAAMPALTGLGFATTLGLVGKGRLDGITLAFGAALIGVAIDYPIHLLNHHAQSRGRPPSEVARRLRPALVLGAVTTMASFAGLLLTSFPGFREIGAFAILAVLGALLTTLYVLPSFMPERGRLTAISMRAAEGLATGVRRLERFRAPMALVLAGVAGLAALALPGLRWNDDLSALASLDPELLAEDAALRARVSPFDTGRLVIVRAPDLETALERNALVHERLVRARDAGAFAALRSLDALLWPQALQRRNLRALQTEPHVGERVLEAFAAEGFRAEGLEPFLASLGEPPPPPLTLEELRNSALADLVEAQVVHLGERIGVVTFLREVRDLDAVQRALQGVQGAHLFEQREFANQIFAEFRAATLRQLVVGCVLVLAALLLRYRAWRPALAAFLPSMLCALVLLGAFAALGVEANLLHVVSLILVMGMGVDYGIFLVESRSSHAIGVTLLGVGIACLTTVFVFGTLALSDHVALHAIGITTGLGVMLSFLFAPAAYLLLTPGPLSRAEDAEATEERPVTASSARSPRG